MFSNLSNLSEGVNTAFFVIFGVIFFFLIVLTALLIIFIFRYRESRSPVATPIHGNTTLEIIWTVIPLILVVGMFYYGWKGYEPMEKKPPKGAIPIHVTARMWHWSFKYANGKQEDTLIVPQGKAVSLNLHSMDVIHGFYIPAFRLKKDVIPGRDRTAWFVATTPGTYDLFCSQYCGLNHSHMITAVKVLTKKDFDKWYGDTTKHNLLAAKTASAVPVGKTIVQKIGCFACHSINGTRIVGPTWLHLYGSNVTVITNGKERVVKADDAYIRHSILDPPADIVKGYPNGLMQSYKGQLSDADIKNIIDYLKTLK